MNSPLESLDIPAWVAKATADKKNFREAVHIILTAIGQSTALRTKMIMKGGMLMALRYESSRFTKDADFSTRDLYIQGNETELIAELDAQLALATAELPYDTSCRIQRSELKPSGADKTFPTLALNIGYAPKSNARAIVAFWLNNPLPSLRSITATTNQYWMWKYSGLLMGVSCRHTA
jgi:hypothetical protein